MGEINKVLVVLRKDLNDFLISLKLSRRMLHRIEDKNTFRYVIILVCSEPIWENGIRSP
jgi:hypothetical protein